MQSYRNQPGWPYLPPHKYTTKKKQPRVLKKAQSSKVESRILFGT